MQGNSHEQSSETMRRITGFLVVALYVLMGTARLLHNPHLQRLTPFISVAILMGFAIVHGTRRYGWRHFVIFFIVAFVISWSYETLSILTGFPFGHYVYTDNLGPKLWLVPLLIMPAYFSMGYIAWTLAHVLLDRFDDRLAGAEVVLVSALRELRDGYVGSLVSIRPARQYPVLGSGVTVAATSACPFYFLAGTFAFSRFTWCLHCICGTQASKEKDKSGAPISFVCSRHATQIPRAGSRQQLRPGD